MAMSEELKPCPFCGGKAKLMTMEYDGQKCYGVFCIADLAQRYQHSHCIDNYGSKETAIEVWNRRICCEK